MWFRPHEIANFPQCAPHTPSISAIVVLYGSREDSYLRVLGQVTSLSRKCWCKYTGLWKNVVRGTTFQFPCRRGMREKECKQTGAARTVSRRLKLSVKRRRFNPVMRRHRGNSKKLECDLFPVLLTYDF